jgi:hypothetical protein
MGYYIFSFGIKTDEILKAFNSKDESLQSEVQENEVFQNYADFEVDGFGTKPDKALVDIIQGRHFDSKSNYAYGYAVIGLCATLGEGLPYGQEIKLGYETDLINKVLVEDFGINDLKVEERLFVDNSHPFPIPKIEDWPLIGLVKHEHLAELKNKLASVNITEEQIEELEDDPDEKGFAYEHLKGILENVNFCFDNNLDLISFCH